MPQPRKHKPGRAASREALTTAADALVGVAPLASRWMERLLAGHEPALTLGQYLALRAIEREPLVAAELARRTGVSGPAVSQLVAGLDQAGFVVRTPAPGDRRRHELGLSAEGSRVLASANALMRERLGGLVADLPAPEADALARALPQAEALLAGTAPPRRPPPPPPPPPVDGPASREGGPPARGAERPSRDRPRRASARRRRGAS